MLACIKAQNRDSEHVYQTMIERSRASVRMAEERTKQLQIEAEIQSTAYLLDATENRRSEIALQREQQPAAKRRKQDD